jgi:hypothetical protein
VGPLVVDMRSSAARRAGHILLLNDSKQTTTQSQSPQQPARAAALERARPLQRRPAAFAVQPSPAVAHAEMFYIHFVDQFFTHSPKLQSVSWLHQLPGFYVHKNDALQLATRATVTAYCSLESGNWEQLRLAKATYGEALKAQWQLVHSVSKSEVPVTRVMPVALMFSIFESMTASSGEGYRLHIENAFKMVEGLPAEERASPKLWQLFESLQLQMVCMSNSKYASLNES